VLWRPNVISRRRGANRWRASGPVSHPPSPGLLQRECDRAASRDGVTAMPRMQSSATDRPGRVRRRRGRRDVRPSGTLANERLAMIAIVAVNVGRGAGWTTRSRLVAGARRLLAPENAQLRGCARDHGEETAVFRRGSKHPGDGRLVLTAAAQRRYVRGPRRAGGRDRSLERSRGWRRESDR
jgi:hypothetical protein